MGQRTFWSDSERETLRNLVSDGVRPTTAHFPNRTEAAIDQYQYVLGLKVRKRKCWKATEDDEIKRFRANRPGVAKNRVLPGRTIRAVSQRASQLGVSNKDFGRKVQLGKQRAAELRTTGKRFEKFLRRNRLRMTAREIGAHFGVGGTFIRSEMTRLGIAPTRAEILASPERRKERALRRRETYVQTKSAKVIEMISRLEHQQDFRIRRGHAVRACKLCRTKWPDDPAFFLTAQKDRAEWEKASIRSVCRRCRLLALLEGTEGELERQISELCTKALLEQMLLRAARAKDGFQPVTCKKCRREWPATAFHFPSRSTKSRGSRFGTCRLCCSTTRRRRAWRSYDRTPVS